MKKHRRLAAITAAATAVSLVTATASPLCYSDMAPDIAIAAELDDILNFNCTATSINFIPRNNASLNNYEQKATVVSSYMYENGDGFTRVESLGSGQYRIADYDSRCKLSKSSDLNSPLPVFGGFYSGSDANYLIFGDNNPDSDPDKAVFCIEKYSKDWDLVNSLTLCGENTTTPFKSGSLRCTELNGSLYIYTCHTMMPTSDGVMHQANMLYKINESDMTVEESLVDVGSRNIGYFSHSYNQFIVTDGTDIYRCDQGDTLPRALIVTRQSPSDPITKVKYIEALPFGGRNGSNSTGCSVGAFEVNDKYCIAAINTVDQNAETYSATGQRNIVLVFTAKDLSSAKEVYLTNFGNDSGISPRTPHMVKVNDDKFIVMWEEYNSSTGSTTVNGACVNGEGDVLESSFNFGEATLSDCAPVLFSDGTIRWYSGNENTYLYTLSEDDSSSGSGNTETFPYGDVNGDGYVDAKDASLVFKHYAYESVGFPSPLTEEQIKAGDVNFDGILRADDASKILRYYNMTLAGYSKSFMSYLTNEDDGIVVDFSSIDHTNGFTDEQIAASAIKPEFTITASQDETNNKICVNVNIENSENAYASFGLKLRFDERLKPAFKSDGSVDAKYGNALSAITNSDPLYINGNNVISLSGTSSYDDGKDGKFFTVYFDIPDDAKNGDTYTFSLVNDGNTMFTNAEDDETGRLMEAYLMCSLPVEATVELDISPAEDTTEPVTTTMTEIVTTTAIVTEPATTTTTEPVTPVETPSLGDVNGDGAIDAIDASLIFYEYARVMTGSFPSFTDEQQDAANVNGDEYIDAKDAYWILKYYQYRMAGGTNDIFDYVNDDFNGTVLEPLSSDRTNGFTVEEIEGSAVKPHMQLLIINEDEEYGNSDTYMLEVYITDSEYWSSLGFTISYDPAIEFVTNNGRLVYDIGEAAKYASMPIPEINTEKGLISISAACENDMGRDGNLITLYFKDPGTAKRDYEFTVDHLGGEVFRRFANDEESRLMEAAMFNFVYSISITLPDLPDMPEPVTTTTTEAAVTTTTELVTTTTAVETEPTTTTTKPAAPSDILPLGDVNNDGAVNASDASIILVEYAAIMTGEGASFTPQQFIAGDVNSDGKIDSVDASDILRFYAYTQTGGDCKTMEEWKKIESEIA